VPKVHDDSILAVTKKNNCRFPEIDMGGNLDPGMERILQGGGAINRDDGLCDRIKEGTAVSILILTSQFTRCRRSS